MAPTQASTTENPTPLPSLNLVGDCSHAIDWETLGGREVRRLPSHLSPNSGYILAVAGFFLDVVNPLTPKSLI